MGWHLRLRSRRGAREGIRYLLPESVNAWQREDRHALCEWERVQHRKTKAWSHSKRSPMSVQMQVRKLGLTFPGIRATKAALKASIADAEERVSAASYVRKGTLARRKPCFPSVGGCYGASCTDYRLSLSSTVPGVPNEHDHRRAGGRW